MVQTKNEETGNKVVTHKKQEHSIKDYSNERQFQETLPKLKTQTTELIGKSETSMKDVKAHYNFSKAVHLGTSNNPIQRKLKVKEEDATLDKISPEFIQSVSQSCPAPIYEEDAKRKNPEPKEDIKKEVKAYIEKLINNRATYKFATYEQLSNYLCIKYSKRKKIGLNTKVNYINVGAGNAVFVTDEQGKKTFIDTGTSDENIKNFISHKMITKEFVEKIRTDVVKAPIMYTADLSYEEDRGYLIELCKKVLEEELNEIKEKEKEKGKRTLKRYLKDGSKTPPAKKPKNEGATPFMPPMGTGTMSFMPPMGIGAMPLVPLISTGEMKLLSQIINEQPGMEGEIKERIKTALSQTGGFRENIASVITHDHSDHNNGGRLLKPPIVTGHTSSEEGMKGKVKDETGLEVISSETENTTGKDENDHSLVLYKEVGNSVYIFPGDRGKEDLMALIKGKPGKEGIASKIKGKEVVFMAGHHGSVTSMDAELLQSIEDCAPNNIKIIISAGKLFHHPSAPELYDGQPGKSHEDGFVANTVGPKPYELYSTQNMGISLGSITHKTRGKISAIYSKTWSEEIKIGKNTQCDAVFSELAIQKIARVSVTRNKLNRAGERESIIQAIKNISSKDNIEDVLKVILYLEYKSMLEADEQDEIKGIDTAIINLNTALNRLCPKKTTLNDSRFRERIVIINYEGTIKTKIEGFKVKIKEILQSPEKIIEEINSIVAEIYNQVKPPDKAKPTS